MSVIEKMRHGRRYTTPLDVAGEREALAELALFERDPEAYYVQSLDAQTFAAFAGLVERGKAPVESYVRKEVRAAAKRLRRPPLHFGRVRHCFVTWART